MVYMTKILNVTPKLKTPSTRSCHNATLGIHTMCMRIPSTLPQSHVNQEAASPLRADTQMSRTLSGPHAKHAAPSKAGTIGDTHVKSEDAAILSTHRSYLNAKLALTADPNQTLVTP